MDDWYSARAALVIDPKVPVGPMDASFSDAGPFPSIARNTWRAQTSVPLEPMVRGRPLFDDVRSWITRERSSVRRVSMEFMTDAWGDIDEDAAGVVIGVVIGVG